MSDLEELFIKPTMFCKYIEKCRRVPKIDAEICFENPDCGVYKFYEKYGINYKINGGKNGYNKDGNKGIESFSL